MLPPFAPLFCLDSGLSLSVCQSSPNAVSAFPVCPVRALPICFPPFIGVVSAGPWQVPDWICNSCLCPSCPISPVHLIYPPWSDASLWISQTCSCVEQRIGHLLIITVYLDVNSGERNLEALLRMMLLMSLSQIGNLKFLVDRAL